MKKLVLMLFIVVAVFVGLWFVISSVDWVKLFKLEKFTQRTEQKLGDLLWDSYSAGETEAKNPIVYKALDSLVTKMCIANSIDRSTIKLHVFEKSEINAFAFPGGHLVVFTGLINASENQDELIGVVGHELAHIQLQHVMRKLTKEIGLSVLISIATGTGDGAVVGKIVKMLSSTAFDRTLEKQADFKAVDYMIKASIDPIPLADFMERLADGQEMEAFMVWMSTHPESAVRATYIREYANAQKYTKQQILSYVTWNKVKKAVE